MIAIYAAVSSSTRTEVTAIAAGNTNKKDRDQSNLNRSLKLIPSRPTAARGGRFRIGISENVFSIQNNKSAGTPVVVNGLRAEDQPALASELDENAKPMEALARGAFLLAGVGLILGFTVGRLFRRGRDIKTPR